MNEKLMLMANEKMPASKAYMMFAVNSRTGIVEVVTDQSALSPLEGYGFLQSIKNFDPSCIKKPEGV